MNIEPGEVKARVQALAAALIAMPKRHVERSVTPRVLAAGALVAILLLSALGGLDGARRAAAQEPITILSDAAQNEFPAGVTFSVTFTAPALAADVRLRYELAPDGTGATAIASCTGTSTITCSYPLLSGRGIFIIPGAEITYHWDIEDEQGNSISTPDALYVHQDTRFDFRTLSDGNVTVYFHAGTEDAAPGVLAAAVETIGNVGRLEDTQVPFPVKVFLYETAEEMQPAIVPNGGRGVTVLGEVVYSDTAMVSSDVETLDITRHEIAHIVTREATRGPFGIPDWMNEGISVFAQRNPLSGHDAALASAIRGDRVLTMPQLNSSATGGVSSTVSLYYGQAGAMVRYLVDTYGEEKFAALLKTFKDGATNDDAFQQVYGFDALGYENEWRASVGLDPRAASATPTAEPTDEARSQPTSESGSGGASSGAEDGDGFPIATVVGIVLLALAGAVAAALLAKTVRERM